MCIHMCIYIYIYIYTCIHVYAHSPEGDLPLDPHPLRAPLAEVLRVRVLGQLYGYKSGWG